ncbi:MAG: hypothetical protein AABX02_00455 [archaeon]
MDRVFGPNASFTTAPNNRVAVKRMLQLRAKRLGERVKERRQKQDARRGRSQFGSALGK